MIKKACFFLLTLLAVQSIFPVDGEAVPAFARKMTFNCSMCHTGFPKLNDFGQRFREDGYQLQGQEGREPNVFVTSFPLAMRTNARLNVDDSKDLTTVGMGLGGLDVFAAGVMHKNVSFLLIYTPRIDEPAATYEGPGEANDNPSQPGSLESANIVFSNIIHQALNVRVGRFEPAYHPISSKRSYYLIQPYDVYLVETPGNGFLFDDNQIGLEATGYFRNGFRYGAGVVNGTGSSPDNNKAKDLYVNLFQTFGRGEGQTAGQRIGGFFYYGWQPLDLPGGGMSSNGEADGKDNKGFYRMGFDGSLNWRTFNLRLLYMKGVDDGEFNLLRPGEDYEYEGGVGELDCAGLMNNKLVLSLAYNWTRTPSYDQDQEIDAYSGLVRYYLGDWTAVNVALHGEYTHRERGECDCAGEDIFALIVDFAF